MSYTAIAHGSESQESADQIDEPPDHTPQEIGVMAKTSATCGAVCATELTDSLIFRESVTFSRNRNNEVL